MTTPDPLSPWHIEPQEWETFTPETLEDIREAVDNPVDNLTDGS